MTTAVPAPAPAAPAKKPEAKPAAPAALKQAAPKQASQKQATPKQTAPKQAAPAPAKTPEAKPAATKSLHRSLERRSQQPAKPTPTTAAPRTQSEGRMNENSGRGSLDGVPSDVAGLEKLRVPDNFSNEFMDCKAPFGFPQAASPPLSVESRTTFSMWLCEQHNVVNRKLNKPVFECTMEKLEERWRKGLCEPQDPGAGLVTSALSAVSSPLSTPPPQRLSGFQPKFRLALETLKWFTLIATEVVTKVEMMMKMNCKCAFYVVNDIYNYSVLTLRSSVLKESLH
ncbi:Erv1 / Alr family [Phytophthora infestans]|uniref:Sulfhydryl oxidase n=2 Tax=Phytophthora infestans TaxID=4787 RepID=A0A833TD57_PHYIN|nr:Erv1 / Alr family [Phytophthora infestans]